MKNRSSYTRRASKHKRRLDRGGVYMGYYQMTATSLILLKVFNLEQWYFYIFALVIVIIGRYVLGWFDEKYILQEEQKQYSELNPVLVEILNKLEKLEKTK